LTLERARVIEEEKLQKVREERADHKAIGCARE
jgi:hypothetical protein